MSIEMILAALAAGASAGITTTASAATQGAVQEAYERFKTVLRSRLEAKAWVVDVQETEQGAWKDLLSEDLETLSQDREVCIAAYNVLSASRPPNSGTVNVRKNTSGAAGVFTGLSR